MLHSCYQLAEFRIEEQITLSGAIGLVKICRSQDGTLMLVCEDATGAIDSEQPALADSDSILGFALDIGIKRIKLLTYGSGFYFGSELASVQSNRPIKQSDYDEKLFAWIRTSINTAYQSADRTKMANAIRVYNLLTTYNNARLLYPNFVSESYLSLMRIIEASAGSSRRYDFALAAAQLSPDLNRRIFNALVGVESYRGRLVEAKKLHAEACAKSVSSNVNNLDDPGRVIFGCFLSAYMYRNKFMHIGFPFPEIVKDSFKVEDDSGMAYIHPAVGTGWLRRLHPEEANPNDFVDMHEAIEPEHFEKFKDIYFQLLPTWYFLKGYAREALLSSIARLGGPQP